MDMEDFVFNRTDGTPQDIFKKIGDIAAIYCSTTDTTTKRNSCIPITLRPDYIRCPDGLNLRVVKRLCSTSVFNKAARYETKNNASISTQNFSARNTITGEFEAVRIHDQMITWRLEHDLTGTSKGSRFIGSCLSATCTCKYFMKETREKGKLCSHVIGQLRRTIYLG